MPRKQEETRTTRTARLVRFEELPPKVREDFQRMRGRLGPQLTLGNFRRTQDGWVATVFTLDGQDGGEFLVLAEEEEEDSST